MEKYVRQLLADLQNAKTNKPEKPNVRVLYPDHPALDYGLDYIVEWEMNPEIPMQGFFGIGAMEFPPIEKLSNQQVKQLVDGILDLWEEFRIYAEFPEKLPIEIQYKLLVKQWSEDFIYASEGNLIFTFCDYFPESCPFGEKYCTCKNLQDEERAELN